MAYQIVRTAKADEQLRDIVLYRAEVAGSVEAALEFLDRLELIAEKHLVFYKVDEERKMVIVYAIVDGRRDYLNLI